MAIKRILHGWTTPERPAAYLKLLEDEIFPRIKGKHIPGYPGIDLLHCGLGDEVEFDTIMTFASLQNVIEFQGEDYTFTSRHKGFCSGVTKPRLIMN